MSNASNFSTVDDKYVNFREINSKLIIPSIETIVSAAVPPSGSIVYNIADSKVYVSTGTEYVQVEMASLAPNGSGQIRNSLLTTDATPTTIHTIPTLSDTTLNIQARVSAWNSTTGSDGACYTVDACVKNVAGTLTVIAQSTTAQEDAAMAAANVVIRDPPVGTNVEVQVVGIGATAINWNGKSDIIST